MIYVDSIFLFDDFDGLFYWILLCIITFYKE